MERTKWNEQKLTNKIGTKKKWGEAEIYKKN